MNDTEIKTLAVIITRQVFSNVMNQKIGTILEDLCGDLGFSQLWRDYQGYIKNATAFYSDSRFTIAPLWEFELEVYEDIQQGTTVFDFKELP